jgi:FkbM family methyltransferase
MPTYDRDQINRELKSFEKSFYYGQWETDKVIETYFAKGYLGKCIEVGASDGVKGSNTKYFEEGGWDALCIEPNIEHAASLEANRKLVRYFACGNSNKTDVLHVFKIGERNTSSSLTSLTPDERLLEDYSDIINSRYQVQVPVRTLGDILENEVSSTPFDKIKKIDFISVDTEGTELEVMEGLDLHKYDIKLLVIENNYNDISIEKYMNSQGYKKDQRYKVNDFYIK